MTREGQPLLHIDTANFSTIEQARFRKNLACGVVILNRNEEIDNITDIHSINISNRLFTFKNKLAKDNEIRKFNNRIAIKEVQISGIFSIFSSHTYAGDERLKLEKNIVYIKSLFAPFIDYDRSQVVEKINFKRYTDAIGSFYIDFIEYQPINIDDLILTRKSLEILINKIKNPDCNYNLKDLDLKLDTANARIKELEAENEQLKRAQGNILQIQNKDVLAKEEKYNPTERETHLLMINALANIITKPDFRAGTAKYLKANGINQSAIYGEITEEITRILNAPETKERSEETIKRRLKEAMGLETQQAD
ncbi:hypothetical protein EV689_11226 [Avibacterium gallinarum]|uniref:Uncharacterized protein n=2 Tax=Avibacterium gallinarum TaxID=755 RepID=A0A379AY76_AVIGA|nr:hypothetical protein EV689_11226 [Avibacterium gallinarum]SUB27358.1 Uncharacterised protein [Avibacterium gallinarum]